MNKLQHYLLKKNEWNDNDKYLFNEFVCDLQSYWTEYTNTNIFPKIHMLRHCVEFVNECHILGCVSEAQIESGHHTLNTLFHNHHHNQSKRIAERALFS